MNEYKIFKASEDVDEKNCKKALKIEEWIETNGYFQPTS